ncbi:DUF2909 family protein [Bacterioplanoides pacificum]|uniref:DUF2909 family protein n=1 Tax=Bacterioplanoides pacificum TaxID=1171596 RepID=A0ABV7VT76_9GAMM
MKILIILTFTLMALSLMAGAGFLLKDDSTSVRLLRSLTLRVSLAIVLISELIIWFFWFQTT